MRRGLVLVLLMVCAFWQVIAIAGQATAFGNADDSAHALLHWQEENHHHNDDGSVTQDDSEESLQHVVADGCLGSLAVWGSTFFTLAPSMALRPDTRIDAALPAPALDGPRRPPRLTA